MPTTSPGLSRCADVATAPAESAVSETSRVMGGLARVAWLLVGAIARANPRRAQGRNTRSVIRALLVLADDLQIRRSVTCRQGIGVRDRRGTHGWGREPGPPAHHSKFTTPPVH